MDKQPLENWKKRKDQFYFNFNSRQKERKLKEWKREREREKKRVTRKLEILHEENSKGKRKKKSTEKGRIFLNISIRRKWNEYRRKIKRNGIITQSWRITAENTITTKQCTVETRKSASLRVRVALKFGESRLPSVEAIDIFIPPFSVSGSNMLGKLNRVATRHRIDWKSPGRPAGSEIFN